MADVTIKATAIIVLNGPDEMRMRIDDSGDLILDAGCDGGFAVSAEMLPALLKLLQDAGVECEEVAGG